MTTAMTYGQVILILFVVLIGYYGFLIFMDIQHLKAAEAAAQENQSEEEIDITDEARSFQPQQVTRDDKKKEEEKKQEEAGNENDSNTEKQQDESSQNQSADGSSEKGNMIPTALKKQPMMLNLKSKRKHLLPNRHHRINLLSRINQLLMLLMKMKLKTLPMRMPKQPHRKLELLPDPTSHRAIGNPS